MSSEFGPSPVPWRQC